MEAFLITIHIMASVILILVVLLQSGKSADLAGAFGGGGSQTAFGPRGAATLLSKITTISAVVFMVTSVSLSIIASKGGSNSVLSGGTPVPASQQSIPVSVPVQPTGAPASQPAAPAQTDAQPTISVTHENPAAAPSKDAGPANSTTPPAKPGTNTPEKKK